MPHHPLRHRNESAKRLWERHHHPLSLRENTTLSVSALSVFVRNVGHEMKGMPRHSHPLICGNATLSVFAKTPPSRSWPKHHPLRIRKHESVSQRHITKMSQPNVCGNVALSVFAKTPPSQSSRNTTLSVFSLLSSWSQIIELVSGPLSLR
jgi:hypothetical protein